MGTSGDYTYRYGKHSIRWDYENCGRYPLRKLDTCESSQMSGFLFVWTYKDGKFEKFSPENWNEANANCVDYTKALDGSKKTEVYVYVEKRLLSIVVSAVILLSFACTAMAAEKSERYVGDSTVNGSIYQTYYQVDAQTRTGVKKISVSGVLYEKGTIGTWQKVSSCSNSSTTSTCMVSSSFNTKPGKSYRLEYSATFSYSDGRSETITGSTSR